VAFDLTAGEELPPSLLEAADMVLLPGADTLDACRLERV
jgi:hypothetical protein